MARQTQPYIEIRRIGSIGLVTTFVSRGSYHKRGDTIEVDLTNQEKASSDIALHITAMRDGLQRLGRQADGSSQ